MVVPGLTAENLNVHAMMMDGAKGAPRCSTRSRFSTLTTTALSSVKPILAMTVLSRFTV